MKKIVEELKWILSQRLYVIALSITAACGYGFEIVTPIIGIDDTAVELYIGDGLEVVMGRWAVYLFNKFFHMSEFSPFMLEVIGVLLLCIAATLFAVFFRRVFQNKVGVWICTIFACVFVSNPIISELYVYYYHNGVEFGYILLALAFWLYVDGMEAKGKNKLLPFGGSMLLAWIAVGCYESLLILYILGILMILFLRAMEGRDKVTFLHLVKYLAIGAGLSLGIILLRSMMIEVLTGIFGLQQVQGEMQQRSLTEILDTFRHSDGLANLTMLIKKYWVVYFVNAICYLPVTGYVISVMVWGIYTIVYVIKKKNIWFFLLFFGMIFMPFILTLMEGQVTYYRSCQYMPFFTASGILLLCLVADKMESFSWVGYVVTAFVVILIFNQATALNENFYVDYLKYDNAREVMTTVAEEIEQDYGNEKPVIFTGSRETPAELVERYCVPYSSKKFQYISGITDLVDEHLKEKYYTPYGYSYAGEVSYSFIDWGVNAFDGTCSQLIKFLNMHGYSFTTIRDRNVQEGARQIGETMPRWPKEGSIVELENYILVHF